MTGQRQSPRRAPVRPRRRPPPSHTTQATANTTQATAIWAACTAYLDGAPRGRLAGDFAAPALAAALLAARRNTPPGLVVQLTAVRTCDGSGDAVDFGEAAAWAPGVAARVLAGQLVVDAVTHLTDYDRRRAEALTTARIADMRARVLEAEQAARGGALPTSRSASNLTMTWSAGAGRSGGGASAERLRAAVALQKADCAAALQPTQSLEQHQQQQRPSQQQRRVEQRTHRQPPDAAPGAPSPPTRTRSGGHGTAIDGVAVSGCGSALSPVGEADVAQEAVDTTARSKFEEAFAGGRRAELLSDLSAAAAAATAAGDALRVHIPPVSPHAMAAAVSSVPSSFSSSFSTTDLSALMSRADGAEPLLAPVAGSSVSSSSSSASSSSSSSSSSSASSASATAASAASPPMAISEDLLLMEHLEVGGYSAQGSRESNEDEFTVVERFDLLVERHAEGGAFTLTPDGDGVLDAVTGARIVPMAYVGVYDGHNGVDAARFLAENLHVNVARCWRRDRDACEALSLGFARTERDWMLAANAKPPRMFGGAETDAEATEGENYDSSRDDLDTNGDPIARNYSGAVGVVCVIQGRHVAIANLGDCRAVLCQEAQPVTLTRDHVPTLAGEQARIEAAGGKVQWSALNGEIDVSRAFGDVDSRTGRKVAGMTHDPETHSLVVTRGRDEFLLLACDGLWGPPKLDADTVMRLVRPSLHDHNDVALTAKELCDQAINNYASEDNVTVVIVGFANDDGYVVPTERARRAGRGRAHGTGATLGVGGVPAGSGGSPSTGLGLQDGAGVDRRRLRPSVLQAQTPSSLRSSRMRHSLGIHAAAASRARLVFSTAAAGRSGAEGACTASSRSRSASGGSVSGEGGGSRTGSGSNGGDGDKKPRAQGVWRPRWKILAEEAARENQ